MLEVMQTESLKNGLASFVLLHNQDIKKEILLWRILPTQVQTFCDFGLGLTAKRRSLASA
jgi:hypothetical protein